MGSIDTQVHNAFRTAVVPAAGMGTRFLPATKTVPKELLPVVDTPGGIELVASEAAESGASKLVIVTAPGKDGGVVSHFVEDLVLESRLEESGKSHLLEKVRRAPNLLDVESVVQERPLGLGHAVGCAEQALADDEDAIAVLLPDDLVQPCGILDLMARVRAERGGGSVLCAIDVPKSLVGSYGIFHVEEVQGGVAEPDVLKVLGWWRSRRSRTRRRHWPPPAGICSTAPSSTPCAASNPVPEVNSSSPTPSPCSSTKGIRSTWSFTAEPATTWEIRAAICALRSIPPWTAPTTGRDCADGSSSASNSRRRLTESSCRRTGPDARHRGIGGGHPDPVSGDAAVRPRTGAPAVMIHATVSSRGRAQPVIVR